jgi:hypothetical protein
VKDPKYTSRWTFATSHDPAGGRRDLSLSSRRL